MTPFVSRSHGEHALPKTLNTVFSERTLSRQAQVYADHLKGLGLANSTATKHMMQGLLKTYQTYGRTIRQALENEHYEIALVKVIELYQAEDAVIKKTLSPQASFGFRREMLRSRTSLAATVAALANLPWDDTIAW